MLNDEVITSVIDEGSGIPEEDFTKLFIEFPVGIEKYTGLDHSIAKKIVEKHGGVIGIESKAGKGSNFYYKLPIDIQQIIPLLDTLGPLVREKEY